MKINHPSTFPELLSRYSPSSLNRCGTFVNLILICDCDGQRGTLAVNPSSRVFSMGSACPRTPLPRKVGFCKRPIACKLLKGWSGRRDSNPRVQLGNMSVDCK